MPLQIPIGTIAKELRAAWPEVGEPGNELLGRRGGRLFEVDRGHAYSLLESSDVFRLPCGSHSRRFRRSPLPASWCVRQWTRVRAISRWRLATSGPACPSRD